MMMENKKTKKNTRKTSGSQERQQKKRYSTKMGEMRELICIYEKEDTKKTTRYEGTAVKQKKVAGRTDGTDQPTDKYNQSGVIWTKARVQ